MKLTTDRPTEVTPAHHVALLFIAFAGSLLLGYFIISKRLSPELSRVAAEERSTRRDIAEARRFIASVDVPDINDLRQMVVDKEGRVRAFEFQREGDGGPPFVNTSDRQAVEQLFAQILREAQVQQITVHANEPKRGQEVDPRFAKLITRQLKLEGTFQQLYAFLAKLRHLPNRVLVLQLDAKEAKDLPGLLEVNLVVSV